jgi:protein SCO1
MIGQDRNAPAPRRLGWYLVLVTVWCTVLAACATPVDNRHRPAPAGGTAANRALPAWVSRLPLTDQAGHGVSLGDFKHQVIVLTDFLSLCREVCPLTSADFRLLQHQADRAGIGDRVQFLEITVDPARDTPARLNAYAGIAGTAPNWKLLTGRPSDLARLWRLLGVDYQKRSLHPASGTDWWTGKPLTYDVDHTDALIFLDGAGNERYVITGAPNAARAMVAPRLKGNLDREGLDNLNHPGEAAWTPRQAMATLRWLACATGCP